MGYISAELALTGCLLEMQTLWLHPDLLYQNLPFNKNLGLHVDISVFGNHGYIVMQFFGAVVKNQAGKEDVTSIYGFAFIQF